MKLERVEIHGFKSFPDRVEVKFHEGMTAIVGPNGCGKSNVSDAIGWVLGEQSAKSLRGSKMEDFIFSGTETRPPVSRSEVNLHVSQVRLREDSEELDANAEVLITRRLYRSGESEYLIDGKPSRLRDIQELFMGTGVGSKAYAIIEQGKIGVILSSKPTDRRLLIEEAAGITKYKSRRHSAELKLSAAQQNLMRVNDIVYEIERQMRSLKRQAGKAKRFRRLRESLVVLERVNAVRESGRLQASIQTARDRHEIIVREEFRRQTSLVTAENFLERCRLKQADCEVGLNDARDALHKLELNIERLEHSIERDRQQILENDDRREQLVSELAALETKHAPALERLRTREQEKASADEELARLQAEANRQQDGLKEYTLSVTDTEKTIEEHRSEVMHRVSKIAALHNFLQGVVANADKVASELVKLDGETKELGQEKARVDSERANVSQHLEKLNTQGVSLGAEFEHLTKQTAQVSAEIQELEDKLGAGRDRLTTQSARLSSLEEVLSARTHFGSAARELLEKADELPFEVLGSLADAIEVDPRFERAADGFLADCLQRVRVRTAEHAAAARRYLSEQDERSRCELILEELLPEEPPLRAIWREILSRLSGLEGVIGLMSEGLRLSDARLARSIPEAVIVADLDAAFRAFSQVPATYVTLQGDVLEVPGTLRLGPLGEAGGLLQTRREARELRAAIEVSRDALNELEAEFHRRSSERAERAKRLQEVTDARHALDKELVGVDHKRQQWGEEYQRLERKKEVLDSERERAVSERAAFASKRSEMEQSLIAEDESKTRAETTLETMLSSLVERRAEVERRQRKTAEEVSRLAALKERTDAVGLDVSRLREGLKDLVSRLESNQAEQLELATRVESLKTNRANAGRELKESVDGRHQKIESFKRLENELTALRERIDGTDKALKLRRLELDSVKKERSGQDIELAKEETDHDHLLRTFRDAHGLELSAAAGLLSPAELSRSDDGVTEELADVKSKIDAIGAVNPMADEEFEELETRHSFVTKQRQDLLDAIKATETAIGRIDRTSRQRFREAFAAINENFEVTFKQLFGGGRAGLRLLDETDVLESGIDVIAQPPGKKLQNVLLLSGGEKALTAISLLFAIFRYRPSPFCLLDEVDAPLDDANVGRFLTMLMELRDTTQFIVITHNRKTMEMADQLYGVTMEEPGVSKLVSVDLGKTSRLEGSLAAR